MGMDELVPRLLLMSVPVSAILTLFRLLGSPLTGENMATGDPRLEERDGGGTCG